MFEHRSKPLLPRRAFYARLARSACIGLLVIAFALGIGMIGYRAFEPMSWVDAFRSETIVAPPGLLRTIGAERVHRSVGHRLRARHRDDWLPGLRANVVGGRLRQRGDDFVRHGAGVFTANRRRENFRRLLCAVQRPGVPHESRHHFCTGLPPLPPQFSSRRSEARGQNGRVTPHRLFGRAVLPRGLQSWRRSNAALPLPRFCFALGLQRAILRSCFGPTPNITHWAMTTLSLTRRTCRRR